MVFKLPAMFLFEDLIDNTVMLLLFISTASYMLWNILSCVHLVRPLCVDFPLNWLSACQNMSSLFVGQFF